MTEILSEQQLSPRYLVEVTKPSHLSWWAAAFDVPEQAVSEAVEVVGPQAIEVLRYLQRDRAHPTDRSAPHHASDRRCSDRRGTALWFPDEVLAGEVHHGSEPR